MTRLKYESTIATMLTKAYDRVVIHKSLVEVAINGMPLLELEEVNEEGEVVTALSGYGSMKTIHDALGNQFTLTEKYNGFYVIRWSFRKASKDEMSFKELLESMGLTDFMSDNVSAKHTDFTSIQPNHFCLLNAEESQYFPSKEEDETL